MIDICARKPGFSFRKTTLTLLNQMKILWLNDSSVPAKTNIFPPRSSSGNQWRVLSQETAIVFCAAGTREKSYWDQLGKCDVSLRRSLRSCWCLGVVFRTCENSVQGYLCACVRACVRVCVCSVCSTREDATAAHVFETDRAG